LRALKIDIKCVSPSGWPSLCNSEVYDPLLPKKELFDCISQCIHQVLTEQYWYDIDNFNMTEYSLTDFEKGDQAGSK